MLLKSIMTGAASLALAAAPTAVAAQASPPTQMSPAPERIEEESALRRTGILIPLAVITAIIIAVLLFTKDEGQVSP